MAKARGLRAAEILRSIDAIPPAEAERLVGGGLRESDFDGRRGWSAHAC